MSRARSPGSCRRLLALGLGMLGMVVGPPRGFATETADSTAMSRTLVVVKLASNQPLETRANFRPNPPTIVIEFPDGQVLGSLPERTTVGQGAVRSIATRYHRRRGAQEQRFVQSLEVVLSAPFTYRVRSEPGSLMIEVDHPASVTSRTMEVGLRGGTIIEGVGQQRVSERFRAMQNALEQAAPSRWTWQLTSEPAGQPSAVGAPPSQGHPAGSARAAAGIAPTGSTRGSTPKIPATSVWITLAILVLAAAGGRWVRGSLRALRTWVSRAPAADADARLPSGIVLIDHLVWLAFERQGYHLVTAMEPIGSNGTLRVIAKEASKVALAFVWNGLFFERRTVEQFISAMRAVKVTEGFLVASGSFTVPAQRLAKEHQITLIGREQLMEVLSTSATSEYFTKQLEQAHARLEEAKGTLRQYANELDILRRQRNEASWYLGEERAKAGSLETQLAEVSQQLRHHEAELEQWEQEASRLRKQWEESEWYLGEARARLQHLETQLGALQELAKRVEPAERERDEASWYLGEARGRLEDVERQLGALQEMAKRIEPAERERDEANRSLGEAQAERDALAGQLAQLQAALQASSEREQALEAALGRAKTELHAIRARGERRSGIRKSVAEAFVELHRGHRRNGPIFSGTPRDVSRTGIGLETGTQLPANRLLQIRLTLPGLTEPIESKARVVWQQADGEPPRYHTGCQFVGLSDEARSLIDERVEQA